MRDTEHKGLTHTVTPKWSREERAELASGVRQHSLERRFDMMMKKADSSRDLNALIQVRMDMKRTKEMPDEAIYLPVDQIDWDSIAKHLDRRTAGACRSQWVNVDNPLITKGAWTKAEEKELLKLAKTNEEHKWVEIAQQLQTNRTAMQCFMKYQRGLNPSLVASKWTPREDETLRLLTERFGTRNWQQVALHLPLRTDNQCFHRWMKSVNPSIKSGRWTPEEDLRLRYSFKAFGSGNDPLVGKQNVKWSSIARFVEGRTDIKCRERWMNILNPQVTKGKWTKEEDKRLLALTEQLGQGNWTKVAAQMHPRTDNQCWRRWKKVANQSTLSTYRKNVNLKRKKMVRNFVGRKRERPKLTVEDVSSVEITSVATSIDRKSVV